MRTLRCVLIVLCVSWVLAHPAMAEEETYTLEESAGNTQVFDVAAELDVQGKLKTTAGKEKILALDLVVDASFKYQERRLPGAGRDAASLRSLRSYNQAKAEITVNRNRNFASLAKTNPLIVAHGHREGLLFYQTDELMTRNELGLLQMPGDGLAMLGLLPQTKVKIGQKWTPENWAVQMLTGTEALLKSTVSCELESVRNELAKVRVSGELEGAVQGATTKIELSGHYVIDTKRNFLRSVELKQTEKRGVGAVSPGMDVTANLVLSRTPADGNGQLTEKAIDNIPLEPKEDQLRLVLKLPWNATVSHNRDWHVFTKQQNLTVLRLIKGGSLIAQCNLSPLSKSKTGNRMSETEFRDLAKKGLGESLKSIESANTLSDKADEYIHRIIAKGESQKIDMTWHYYLTEKKDRQMLFFVAFETGLKEKLGEDDLKLVQSLKLEQPKLIPSSGEK